MERVLYECRLYGDDVYYEYSQYCFWRTVVKRHNPDWMPWVPGYFLRGEPPPEVCNEN